MPPLGSGRRIASQRSLEDCLASLTEVIWGYRSPQYPEMPPFDPAGYTWNTQAGTAPPNAAVCFPDASEDFLLVAFWRQPTGTELGVFPLGSGDERLQQIPTIGHWKQQDPTLRSIGVMPAGLITLAPPPVPEQYCADILTKKSFPVTEHTQAIGWSCILEMFLLKCSQFIESKDPRAVERFIDSHGWTGEPGHLQAQQMLTNLATWDFNVLPYMQDIPPRIRALVLDVQNGQLESRIRGA